MSAFNTIHVFSYGEAQIIGETNGKVDSSTLTKLEALVDHIKTFKPEEVVLTDYHVIHVFNGTDARYLGKGSENKKDVTSFSVKIADLDSTILNEFVEELKGAVLAAE